MYTAKCHRESLSVVTDDLREVCVSVDDVLSSAVAAAGRSDTLEISSHIIDDIIMSSATANVQHHKWLAWTNTAA